MKKSLFLGILMTSFSLYPRSFTLQGGLGMDYYVLTQKNLLRDIQEEQSYLNKRAYLLFSSHFWSKKLLKYTLFANIESADLKDQTTTGSSTLKGYWGELLFFPHSPNQFKLRLGRNTYTYDRTFGPDFSRINDFWELQGVLKGWHVSFSHYEETLPQQNQMDRTYEDGVLRKAWQTKKTSINLDLRHFFQRISYFDYRYTQDYLHTLINHQASDKHQFIADLFGYRYLYEDPLGLSNKVQAGISQLQWQAFWSPSWENFNRLYILYSTGGDNTWIGETLHRYQLSPSWKGELTLGYVISQEEGFQENYPYEEGGFYFQKHYPSLSWQLQGGVAFYQRGEDSPRKEEWQPYFVGGFTHRKGQNTLLFEVNYHGIKAQVFHPTETDIHLGKKHFASLTRNFIQVKGEDRLHLRPTFGLHWLSLYQDYEETIIHRTTRTHQLSHQGDLSLGKGTLGLRWVKGKIQGDDLFQDYTLWNGFLQFNLNTHLSIQANYLIRDRHLKELSERDEEGSLILRYAIGKFSFEGWGQMIKTTGTTLPREDRVIRLTLTRRFGNG